VALDRYSAVAGADGRFVLPRSWGSLNFTHPDFFPRQLYSEVFPVNLMYTATSEPLREGFLASAGSQLEYLESSCDQAVGSRDPSSTSEGSG